MELDVKNLQEREPCVKAEAEGGFRVPGGRKFTFFFCSLAPHALLTTLLQEGLYSVGWHAYILEKWF